MLVLRRSPALIGSVVLAVAVTTGALACTDSQRPNVLLISIDTLRADHVGAYGYQRDTTPNLDALAQRGVRFERAWVNTHGTPPSHATMLTGLYQQSHRVSFPSEGVRANHLLADELVSVAESFSRAGYRTVAETGGGYIAEVYGFNQGFELWRGERSRPLLVAVDAMVSRLASLLEAPEEASRPIFSFFHTYEVHSPYGAPAAFTGIFGDFPSVFVPTSKSLLGVSSQASSLAPRDLDSVVARYDEGIRFTDHALGLLIERLEAIGLLENAIVVVTSDHGEEFGEHGGLLHRPTLYEELVRVPLIVFGPGIAPGRVVENPVSHIDLAPTLLDLAGVQHPVPLPGRSLVAEMRGVDVGPTPVFQQYSNQIAAVVAWPYKLIRRNADGEDAPPGYELYDLAAGSGETTNLAATHPEVVADLSARIDHWRATCATALLASPRSRPVVSDAKAEELEALGYIE